MQPELRVGLLHCTAGYNVEAFALFLGFHGETAAHHHCEATRKYDHFDATMGIAFVHRILRLLCGPELKIV